MRLLFCILMFVVVQAYAATEYTLTDAPDWVDHVETLGTQELPDDQIRNGVHYLLVDKQVEVPAQGEPLFFYRYATYITNQAGLDSESQVNISFDPSYEKVQLHNLVVKRDGLVIDKFTSAQIKVLDQEDELEDQIYNGEKTINILLDDLRVGDTIDYSYTIIGANPVMGGSFDAYYDLQWSVPVAQVITRVIWKKEKPLNIKVLNSDLTFAQTAFEGGTEYRLDSRDVKSIYWDDDTPSWVNPYASVYLSDSENWRSIVDWGMGLFEPVIKSEPAIVKLANKFSSQGQSEADTITEALRFVQSEVRYVGIELGENSHQASPAGVTLDRRYGDCKDKAVLLLSILREKGIESYPALVSTVEKNALKGSLPSKNAFNHVIVAVEHNNQTYWLDPTRQYQYGKLEDIYQPDYGQALVLNATSETLVSMNPEPRTGQVTTDYFFLSGGNADDVIFTSNTEYFGLSAEKQINYVESDGVDLIRKNYLEYYQDYYPAIENLGGPKFESDPETLRLLLEEKYIIKDFWESDAENQRYVGWVYSNAINSYLSQPELVSRSMDYKLSHPVNVTHNISLQLSDQEWSFEDEEFSQSNEFFEYHSKATYDGSNRILKLSFSYVSKADHVPVADYPRYLKALEAARDDTDYGIYDYFDLPDTQSETEFDEVIAGISVYLLLLVLTVVAYIYSWRVRHVLLTTLFAPLLMYFVGSQAGYLPSESVVEGDRLLNRDIKFMQRKGILNPSDEVIYFYSDAFLNIRDDGNGFSERHVFSYWLDDQDEFNQETVEFDEIADIKVSWSESFDENTTVEVFRGDKSKLLLFLSATDGKDKLFVKALKSRWNKGTVDAS